MTFDYSRDFDHIDFRKQPELYRIGKGEQGVLLVEAYKSFRARPGGRLGCFQAAN